MATGDQFVNVTQKRIMGVQDFRERMIDYVKKVVADIHDVAFGLDGVFGGVPITLSAGGHGNDRFQLDSDATCSDGDGHFTKTNAALAGRDVGLAFENTSGQTYDVGLHFAERPRVVQINPRTGLPEFAALEEHIGERADPDLVTDNANGTMTFRVDSVADPFGTGPRTHSGRKCLVWKKQPGKTATTDLLAIEEAIVSWDGSNNSITTTTIGSGGAGTFGEAVPSTLASDYFVMLLGPTITRMLETDLDVEPNYVFIGQVDGNGPAAVPVTFDTTNQNDLSSGFAVDLNAITRLDSHGDLKIRVRADALDSNEKQIEVQNSVGTTTWAINEAGRMGILGDSASSHALRVFGGAELTQIDGTLDLGFGIGGLAGDLAEETPRLKTNIIATGAPTLLWQITEAFGLPALIYYDQIKARFILAQNCTYDVTTDSWTKGTASVAARIIDWRLNSAAPGLLMIKTRFDGSTAGPIDDDDSDGGGAKWDHILKLQLAEDLVREFVLRGLAGMELRGSPALGLDALNPDAILRLGEASEADTANGAVHPRIRCDAVAVAGQEFTLLWQSNPGTGATDDGNARLYVHRQGGFVGTLNAVFVGTTWGKDEDGKAAYKVEMRSGAFSVFSRIDEDNGTWSEAQWGHSSQAGDPDFTVDLTGGPDAPLIQFQGEDIIFKSHAGQSFAANAAAQTHSVGQGLHTYYVNLRKDHGFGGGLTLTAVQQLETPGVRMEAKNAELVNGFQFGNLLEDVRAFDQANRSAYKRYFRAGTTGDDKLWRYYEAFNYKENSSFNPPLDTDIVTEMLFRRGVERVTDGQVLQKWEAAVPQVQAGDGDFAELLSHRFYRADPANLGINRVFTDMQDGRIGFSVDAAFDGDPLSSNPAGVNAQTNALVAKNIPKAWGEVIANSAVDIQPRVQGVTAGTTGEAFNILSVTPTVGAEIEWVINFASGFTGTGDYEVWLQAIYSTVAFGIPNYLPHVTKISAGSFGIRAKSPTVDSFFDLTTGGLIRMMFVVFGKQT